MSAIVRLLPEPLRERPGLVVLVPVERLDELQSLGSIQPFEHAAIVRGVRRHFNPGLPHRPLAFYPRIFRRLDSPPRHLWLGRFAYPGVCRGAL